jgi:threonyl-tRNA synthetase
MLLWHVDYFRSTITEKGRSPLVEPYVDPVVEAVEALVVFAAVEKDDEGNPASVADRGAEEVNRLARNLKVARLVLVPFAHLFADLADPQIALVVLGRMQTHLLEQGLEVQRVPFGWFNELEIRAKGHPLSRVARTVRAQYG